MIFSFTTIQALQLAAGLFAGALAAIAYFVHLSRHVTLLVNDPGASSRLLFSAVLRVSALLATGWLLIHVTSTWGGAGFAISFIMVRTLAISRARRSIPTRKLAETPAQSLTHTPTHTPCN